MPLTTPLRLAATIAIGIALRYVVGLHPVWWLAWLGPAALFALALRSAEREARWLVLIAALIGWTVNFSYYSTVMGLPLAVVVVLAESLLWRLIATSARAVVLRHRASWTVLAYPVFGVAADTLMAALLPDGNWASLAYSQSETLPVAQAASLFGVSGILFLMMLASSTFAFAVTFRSRRRDVVSISVATLLVLGAAIGYGASRLERPVEGTRVTFGIASIDDAIGLQARPPYIEMILRSYDELVADLADRGARIVVLPEKIGVLTSARAMEWRNRFAAIAARHQIWLEAGIAQTDGQSVVNLAWLFDPAGALSVSYQKHHMAPPERGYTSGETFETRAIDGQIYGLAICKDMHFATLGRAYRARDASVMLVPAWDFHVDAWMGARMTAMRGIENGYSIVRAAREGFLTVSDAYGRVLAEQTSAPLPGTTLLSSVPVGPPVWTLYSRVGDVVGWSCVLAAAWLVAMHRRSSPASN